MTRKVAQLPLPPRRHPVTKEEAGPARCVPPVRTPKFMEFVRKHPCCHCHAPPRSDPHHVGREGLSQKVDDLRCVPLCRMCHDHLERHGTLWTWHLYTRGKLAQVQVELLVAWTLGREEAFI